MPISPSELSQQRMERTISKLVELIDKKLKDSEENKIEFIFNKNTDPKIRYCIVEMYQKVGWKAEINLKNESYVLTLEDPKANSIEYQREALIATALEIPEGRHALAQAMTEPIKVSLMYQGLMRKILMVDELPMNILPRYEFEETSNPIYWSKHDIKSYNLEEETLNDFTEIACNPTIKVSEVKERRFYIVDRAQVRAKDSIQRQEDTILFSLLNKAATFEQTIYTYSETIHRAVEDSIIALEEQEMLGAKIIVHPQTYRYLRNSIDLEESTHREVLQTGVYGHYRTLDVHVSTMCPKYTMYVLPPAQFVGAMAIKQDITVIPADDPARLRIGWVVTETVFPVILNNEFVRKIVVRP